MSFPARSTVLLTVLVSATAAPVAAKQPAEMAGPWVLSFDKTGASCRILLQSDKSDAGDYFLGLPSACRHAMPGISAVGRWSIPDETHLTLDAPGGARLFTLVATADGYAAANPVGTYNLKRVETGRSAAAVGTTDAALSASSPAATFQQIATRQTRVASTGTVSDTTGRYAVMREKRDTGCMLTLDTARTKGGDRAQLAPGCRDQGIVVFDPTAWQIVHGELVLTARAGHKTKLEKQDDGVWTKDPKEGGKPLGLKRL